MSTKAELQTAIDTVLANDQPIPISNLRGLLKDDAVNILDNIYGEVYTDSEATQTLLVLSSAGSCSFDVNYCKQGRLVFLTGRIYNIQQPFASFAHINIAEYLPAQIIQLNNNNANPYSYGLAYKTLANGTTEETTMSIRYSAVPENNSIFFKGGPGIGDELKFSLIWRTKD